MEGPLIEYGLMTKVKMAGYSPIFLCVFLQNKRGKRGGFMVSELDSGSSRPGSSPDRGH